MSNLVKQLVTHFICYALGARLRVEGRRKVATEVKISQGAVHWFIGVGSQ